MNDSGISVKTFRMHARVVCVQGKGKKKFFEIIQQHEADPSSTAISTICDKPIIHPGRIAFHGSCDIYYQVKGRSKVLQKIMYNI